VSSRVAVVVLAGLLVASCGSTDTSTSEAKSSPTVVATTDVWADVVANVVCDAGSVAQLLPSGTDPHGFEASLSDRLALEDAALVVINGLGLEGTLEDTLDAIGDGSVFVVTDHLTTIPLLRGDDDADPTGDDPHVWLDPALVASAIPALVDALGAAGFDRSVIEPCAASYTDRLIAVDGEIATMVETVPFERRKLVTSHESLGYFADRYGFEVVGAVIEGGSSLGGANPAALAALVTAIDATGVGAIFTEARLANDDAVAVGERAGVEVIPLDVEGLSAGAPTYLDLVTEVGRRISEALGG
jgi:zinc/manganese transport system substrate-binding protein